MPDYKEDFPLLQKKDDGGRAIAYLDNGATTQKPRQVIEAVKYFYENYNANPHRGAYGISSRATEAFEGSREKVARFIGAGSADEIVFTSGATDSINMVALTYGNAHVNPGDEILITVMEHHSNLLPWQRLARRKNATLRYAYPDREGRLTAEAVGAQMNPRTKIVAITQVSNVLGWVNPIAEITALAHAQGAVVLVDGAQSVPHMPVDMGASDVDFLAFSGHKMLAPAGIGVLYGKGELLEEMEPLRLGGGIVEEVEEQSVRLLDAPLKFEAGSQNTEGVVGLGAAIDYLQCIGLDQVQAREEYLCNYALEKMAAIPHLALYGGDGGKETGIVAFNIEGVHPHDTATILASHGVAVRAGHHCAQPLMRFLGVNATCRMSLYFYNTEEDIDRMVQGLAEVRGLLGYES